MYVVTGGGTGIGRAVALALHQRGERVAIVGRRFGRLDAVAAESGGAIATVVADCTVAAEVAAMAEGIGGAVHGLVHCAGGNPAIGRADPTDLAGHLALANETLASNLGSAALMVEALAPRMGAGGSIVLFGSIAAEDGVGFYGPAKAAVASYAVGRARALGGEGIRVNCVSPGYIKDTEFFPGGLAADRAEALRSQTALGRVGEPAQVADLVLFLLSGASSHLTGQNFHINGGAAATR